MTFLMFAVAAARADRSPAPAPLPVPDGRVIHVATEAQLQEAVANLSSNTTIVVAAGTYKLTRALTIIGNFSNIDIRGEGASSDDVVLAGPGMTQAADAAAAYGVWTGGGVQGVTISNLTIRDVSRAGVVFASGTKRPRLYNVHLIDAGGGFVRTTADDPQAAVDEGVIESSVIEYTGTAPDTNAVGIDIRGGANWVVRNNVFRNILAPSRQTAGPAILARDHARNTLAERNWIVNSSRGIAFGLAENGGSDHVGGIIRNNVIFRSADQPGDAGILVNDSPGTLVVNNTVFLTSTYGTPIEYRYQGAHDVVLANNLLDGTIWARDGATGNETHNIVGATSDMFVDSVAGDLHLRATAYSAIDRGIESGAVTDDVDGQLRPAGLAYDIGADEVSTDGQERVGAAATRRVSIEGRVVTQSGRGLRGTLVRLTSQNGEARAAVTEDDGTFGFTGLGKGDTYTVTPSQEGYSFTPANRVYAALAASVTSALFTGVSSEPTQPAPRPSSVTILLVSPNSGSSFAQSTVIPVVATIASSGGGGAPTNGRTSVGTIGKMAVSVAKVDFYANSSYIGTDTSSPYTVNWTGGQAGTYALKAVATDSAGATTQSPSVSVVITPASVPTPPAPPNVALTSPSAGSAFTAPATITVNASATSSTGTISKVEFFSGSTLIGTDTSAPYSATWSGVAAGSYSLSAVATDNAGASTRSAAVSITVAAAPSAPAPAPAPTPGPPIVSLTSPAGGSSYQAPATITLSASASSTGGSITSVGFYAGATLIATDTAAPYTFAWSSVPAGSYSLTAVATNNAGATATSTPIVVTVTAPPSSPSPTPQLPSGGLVQAGNLAYQGSFRMPGLIVPGTDRGFDYGGTSPAFNAAHNSLLLFSHPYDWNTAELGIPTPGTGSVGSLPMAPALHGFVDPFGGHRKDVADPTASVGAGGQLPYNGQLYLTAYMGYGSGQTLSHFSRPLDLDASGPINGPYRVGPLGANFYSGYMTTVPPEWQATFGPTLTGQCCLSVISRTSYGPAVFAYDLGTLGTAQNAAPLVYYPSDHKTLGDWNMTSQYFNGTSEVTGLVFPAGTSSVLFFGKQGVGPYCYGEGTDTQSLAGTTDPATGSTYCYDPEGSAKGDHAYPYMYYVWAYDAHDLAAAKAGTKQPWDIVPYAVWQLTLPYQPNHNGHHLGGATYDPATKRLFVSQQYANGDEPVIHIFTLR